jgi:hypothetical protein
MKKSNSKQSNPPIGGLAIAFDMYQFDCRPEPIPLRRPLLPSTPPPGTAPVLGSASSRGTTSRSDHRYEA